VACSADREEGPAHSDDRHSRAYVNRAREVYRLLGVSERLEFLAVGGGHRPGGTDIDPAWQRFFERWLARED
jgi:hypothetical protein